MIDFYLDEHKSICKSYNSTSYFLISLKNKYVLIRFCTCNNFFNHLDYKEELINRIIKDNKVYDYYEVIRERYELDDFLIEKKMQSAIKKNVKQINYIYSDNAGKEYVITTKTNFFDEVFNQEERDKSFEDAKNYLTDNGLIFLIKDLEQLHYSNSINRMSDTKIVKTIDCLLKEINQQLK